MRDVIPGTLLVVFVLSLYAVGIHGEAADYRVARTTPPVRIRIASEYRALNLVL